MDCRISGGREFAPLSYQHFIQKQDVRGLIMEELARELIQGIDTVCEGYHFYKDEEIVMEKTVEFVPKIQQFCSCFLQGDMFGIEKEEYIKLQYYVVEILRDYTEALEQRDIVYILDTLDYGLRELLNIYKNAEETGHE